MFPLLGAYFGSAFLWFIAVWITQDHQLDWLAAVRWMILAGLVGLGIYVGLRTYFVNIPESIAMSAAVVARIGVLFYFVWSEFRGYGMKKVFEIIGIYVGCSLVMSGVSYAFRHL
jgi:hypothetical protein